MVRTKHPVVLIHGVLGYGKRRPLWRKWSPYWPEQALDGMNANYLVVDVGVLSSDHDRACEAFYQLYGGRVDYGEAHSREAGHARYGATFEHAMHPNWSAENPVHLLGHSFGATTAIELYQLICQDAFGVGSNYKWVKSIISVAGPLSGTTLTHLFGLHDGKMRAWTLGHFIGASLCFWHRLSSHFPILKNVYDYRMPQWEFVTSYREIISSESRILASPDLAVYDILPARRLERNSRLKHMDKPYLVSIATSTHSKAPFVEMFLTTVLLGLVGGLAFSIWHHDYFETLVALVLVLAVVLYGRIRQLDYAIIPCIAFLRFQMTWCVRFLHEIFDGFDHEEWEHNDGVVNVVSMLNPLQFHPIPTQSDEDDDDSSGSDSNSTTSTIASSSSSSFSGSTLPLLTTHVLPLDTVESHGELVLRKEEQHASKPSRDAGRVSSDVIKHPKKKPERGRWYVHQVQKNHMASTHFDAEAPALFRKLLHVIANEFEHE
ncbi:hypothetical protein Poli38472_007045 [Pythium oligandrum]|uniref:Lipase-like C-terminal domain-containing protein n=1 Tax=Pythium oligandrum TaxID=41045 RepID=A0A8K1C9D6_PYTOL|nr:hypothetical protein Poli38472_007045 [Pythium oligandrum]|eukprot:TMW58900.1 hypothetical protein Poli38472_007045 [Pythium oligandrum]